MRCISDALCVATHSHSTGDVACGALAHVQLPKTSACPHDNVDAVMTIMVPYMIQAERNERHSRENSVAASHAQNSNK